MLDPCARCKKEGLRCVVKLLTGYCAFCIQLKARCSYIFSNTKRGKIKRKRRRKHSLLLAAKVEASRANAKAAQLRLKLYKLEEKKFAREREEIAATKKLEQLEDTARMLRDSLLLELVTRTANLNILDLELLADLGQSQANPTFFVNSFLNASFLPLPLDFKFRGSFSSIYLLVPELPVLLGA